MLALVSVGSVQHRNVGSHNSLVVGRDGAAGTVINDDDYNLLYLSNRLPKVVLYDSTKAD